MNIFKPGTTDLDRVFVWGLMLIFCSIAMILSSVDAFATATNTSDPIGEVFCNLIVIFRGNTARGIAVVGIIVLGIQTLRGQLKWEVALVIVTGVIILFKAPDIIDMIAGSDTANNCGVSK